MRKRIVIGFKYELEYLKYLPECDQTYIKSTHCFYVVPDSSTIRDLLKKVLKSITQDENKSFDDDYLWGRFWGIINGKRSELNFGFPAAEFYRLNEVDGIAYLYYSVSPRGGAGISIVNDITIYLRPREGNHKCTPHVHVMKGSYDKIDSHNNTVGVRLTDLTVFEGTEKQARRLFRGDWDYVMEIITNNRDRLTDNYNAMLNGGYPEKIKYDPKNKTLIFSSDLPIYPGDPS